MVPTSLSGHQGRQGYNESLCGLWCCGETWWGKFEQCYMARTKASERLSWCIDTFCQATVALSADISEMFLQVEMQFKDRQYYWFLCHSFDTPREPDIYAFQRLLFGNTALPFCSQYVLQNHARTHAVDFSEPASTIDDAMCVDDKHITCSGTLHRIVNFLALEWSTSQNF